VYGKEMNLGPISEKGMGFCLLGEKVRKIVQVFIPPKRGLII
jgi:hypothetical protein